MYMTLSKPMNPGPDVVLRDLPRKGGKMALSDHHRDAGHATPRLTKA